MQGALQNDDIDHFLQCVDDPKKTLAKIEASVEDFQKNDMAGVTSGLFKIGDAVSELVSGIQKCDEDISAREFAIFGEMAEAFKHPKALAQTAGKNIIVNGVEIYKEMSAAYTNYNAKEFEGFGRDVGVSLALVFIGAGDSTVTEGARKAAMQQIDLQLYPTQYGGDSREIYIDLLDAIYTERKLAKAVNADDGIIAHQQGRNPTVWEDDIFYDAEEFMQLQNLMSKRNVDYLY